MSESPRSSRRPSEVNPDPRPLSGDPSLEESEPTSATSRSSSGSEAKLTGNPNFLSPTDRTTTAYSTNSTTGLLSGDGETPAIFSADQNPFTSPGVSPAVTSTSLPSQEAPPHRSSITTAPTVRVNNPHPASPDPNEHRPSVHAPFSSAIDAAPASGLVHRRTSLAATAPHNGSNFGSISSGSSPNDLDEKHPNGAKKTFADRRSMRARGGKSGKKEEQRDMKGAGIKRKPFESTRLKGEIYKPWLEKKDPAQRWARWITIASIVIGIALAAFLCYDGYRSVPNLGKTCLILDDQFNTLDTNTWEHEVRLDGYGAGSFQWTTASDNNSFVDNGILYIVPTLTSDHLGVDAISNGYTLNLTVDGTCTSTNVSECAAVSNSSQLTVINPVQSARLITKSTVNLQYGKVEVRAKFPTGDWLWPRISLLPVEDKYGPWPRSGQINILTGRGNNASYPIRGVDYAQSDLHWGPNADLDRMYLTWGYREQRRTYYNQKWHTFGLEWNDKYMWTYIDSKVSQVVSLRFNKQSFWQRGKFPSTITNHTTGDVQKLISPWIDSPNNAAPFDQPFYLVLDLAVGSTDGWFPDGEGGKPWLDNSGTAMSDFWLAKDKWWNNWPTDPKERGFAIDSVKVWKTGSC